MSKSNKRGNPDHLTIEEAASILRVGQQEISKRFASGSLTRLRASNGELRVSREQVERVAYVESLLNDWPEPTPQQQRIITGLTYGTAPAKTGPSAYELEQQQKAAERQAALEQARKAALSLTACDVCNIQPEQHAYAQRGGIDSHEWMPGRAERIISSYEVGTAS